MILHQEVSNFLHSKGLHEQWQPSPSFIHACDLLGLLYQGDSPRQKRKSARKLLVEHLGIQQGLFNEDPT